MKVETCQKNMPMMVDAGSALAIALLLETVGTARFPTALRQVVRAFCPFDSMLVTRYPSKLPPVPLYHDLDDIQAATSVQFYATGPYLLDPLYIACKSGRDPGVYRTLDLAPEAFFRSEYYRTFYRKIRTSDEIGLLIRENHADWIIVSLALNHRKARFTTGETELLTNLFPIISAAIVRNWGERTDSDRSDDPQLMEDQFETFGDDVLSPREAEIVRLILQGHSSPSAADFLGIAEGTVKAHRHHAYAKLGISSQAELFSMATRYFIGQISGKD